MSRQPKRPPCPWAKQAARSIDELRRKEGLSVRQLCEEIGRGKQARATVARQLAMREYTRMSLGFAADCAKRFGCSLDEIAGVSRPQRGTWRPRHDPAKALSDKYRDYGGERCRVLAVQSIWPSLALTGEVRSLMIESLVAGDKERKRLHSVFNRFGADRTDAWLSKGGYGGVQVVTAMLRSDVETIITGDWPFNRSTPRHRLESLQYLRQEGIKERGYQLLVIEDKSVPRATRNRLDSIESLTVLDTAISFERQRDFDVVWSVEGGQVTEDFNFVRKVHGCPGHVLTSEEVEGYMRRVEADMRSGAREGGYGHAH